jgi:hypothetical protein
VSEIVCAVINRFSSLILTSKTSSKDKTRKMKIMYLFPSTLKSFKWLGRKTIFPNTRTSLVQHGMVLHFKNKVNF